MTAYAGSVGHQLRGKPLEGKEFTARINAEKNGQRNTYHFINMNVYFGESKLKVHPRCRSSAAMTVTSETGSGEKRTRRRL